MSDVLIILLKQITNEMVVKFNSFMQCMCLLRIFG